MFESQSLLAEREQRRLFLLPILLEARSVTLFLRNYKDSFYILGSKMSRMTHFSPKEFDCGGRFLFRAYFSRAD